MKPIYLLALLSVLVAPAARAEVEAMPMPGDTRLVQFVYDGNDTYTILCRPGAVTDVQLSPDENVTAVALGDTVQWQTARSGSHLFIKPLRPDIFTSATIVTDKRTYQATLRAGPENGKWYQMVKWTYPDIILAMQVESDKKHDEAEEKQKQLDDITVSRGVSVEQLNFSYSIEGNAPFKPLQVFDDGKFTWVRMPDNLQELPALFMVTPDGAELVNYVIKGNFMLVQRLVPQLLLKLGKQEVTIKSKTGFFQTNSKGWFSK